MTLQTFFRKLSRLTPGKAWSILRYRLWHTESIMLLSLPKEAPLEDSLQGACPAEFRPVTEENLSDCDVFHDPEHNSKVFKSLLQRGDLGYYGYRGGVCVSCAWAKLSGPVLFGGAALWDLSAADALIHFAYVSPAARGQRIHAFLIHHVLEQLGGEKNMYTLVYPHNTAALKNNFRAGFRLESRVTVKRRFFRVRVIEQPVSGSELSELLNPKGKGASVK